MNTKHSSTATPDTRPIARTVREMRMEAFTLRVIAAGIVGGSVVLAVHFEIPALALGGLVALWPALSAHWLADLASRTAEALPQKPPRIGPRWFMRFYWWIAGKQMQRAAKTKPPWRGIAVAGVEDAIKISRQPNEMRAEKEHAIVAGLTPSDLRALADEALKLRTLDERTWRLNEYRRVLPSGQVLTRGMFRKAQVWFVEQKLAVKEPHYRITVSLDEVDKTLANLK